MKLQTYITKGSKRLIKVLGRIIPHNSSYRPSGVCKINSDAIPSLDKREIKVHSIYPQYITTLDISEDLYEASSPYWRSQRRVATDYIVAEVPHGRLYTDNESSVAIITKQNRIVDNVSLSLKNGKVTDHNLNNIFEQQYFSEPVHLEGVVFSMLTGGAGINNVSHWFLDVLPRLHLLKESGLFDKVDWFLVPSLRYSYQTETLEMLHIPKEKLITGDAYTHITADCIIASTAPRGNYTLVPIWLCEYIRSAFLPFANEELENEEKLDFDSIYISRSDSAIRRVLNEQELLQELEPYGFQCLVSSKFSIKEKVKLFSKAKAVISPTGAGLISMLFCQPGTKLIEIFHEGFVVEPFFDIATKIDLDYEYIICRGNNKVKNASQGQHEHLHVDIEKVTDLLQMLNGKRTEVEASTKANTLSSSM
ncbi:DUF563 domain-containing protein [Pontibacter sp. SGAir0037]|uniref:glycosyltransferase family 61 protein n=1 Tax=Pontibacter sp. SGAir0037 TaxID=2571030 RepID=UPI0010CCE0D7|nr:glycosyltransferase family 61 protein [Pontibacter sp. SGAir0037]QCR22825.1 hypothetical protein C1N53_11045 [Pontibacter sp. SGAir0037]